MVLSKVCRNVSGTNHLFNNANTKAGLPEFSQAYAHNLQDGKITIIPIQDGNQTQGLTTSQRLGAQIMDSGNV